MAAAIVSILGAVAACRQALSNVFDIPPPQPSEQEVPQGVPPPSSQFLPQFVPVDTIRPPIESVRDPDSVVALLPKDRAGNIDWVAALRQGIIAPRQALPGEPSPLPAPAGFQFAFDFVYQGPDTTFDAYFPHSVHTEFVACQQCHPRIFRYRNAPITMGEIFQGKYCAECHGKVSYPITTACERCHQSMSLPPNRAQPDLLGTIIMERHETDSSSAGGLRNDNLPPSVFPHWLHRIRFQCKVCHMEIFEPRAGANVITMETISEGQSCGQCHNGEAAFRAGFGSCNRCHVEQDDSQ